jgi:hypothetical protein
MPRKEENKGYRVALPIAQKCEEMAAMMTAGLSANAFAERALREFLEMAETSPEDRVVPRLILQLDHARAINAGAIGGALTKVMRTKIDVQKGEAPPQSSQGSSQAKRADAVKGPKGQGESSH